MKNIKRKYKNVFRILPVSISDLLVTWTPCELGDLQIGLQMFQFNYIWITNITLHYMYWLSLIWFG